MQEMKVPHKTQPPETITPSSSRSCFTHTKPNNQEENVSTLRNKQVQHSFDGLRGSDSQRVTKEITKTVLVSLWRLLHEAQTL